MKTKLITAIMILAAGIFSCDDDETIQDPIYEFISFGGDERRLTLAKPPTMMQDILSLFSYGPLSLIHRT